MTPSPIEEVLARHTRQWLALDGVAGTAVAEHDGQPCIQVFVTRLSTALAAAIPSQVEGYRVIVQEAGPFRALRAN